MHTNRRSCQRSCKWKRWQCAQVDNNSHTTGHQGKANNRC